MIRPINRAAFSGHNKYVATSGVRRGLLLPIVAAATRPYCPGESPIRPYIDRLWEGGASMTTCYRKRALLLLAMVALLLPLVPRPVIANEDTETGNPLVFGIAGHAWWLDPEVYGDQLLPALDDLRVTTVRLSIDWKRFEPEPGVFEWGLYDRVFGELARRNIVIVANFNTIPAWASVNEGCAIEEQEIFDCQLREEMYPAFERAVQAAVSRYVWIERWEFWNEPEMWRHLGDDTYLRNLRLFYDIAHRINPDVTVAACTLAGAYYMEYIYNVSEAWYGDGNEPWDAIAYHPYSFDAEPGPDGHRPAIHYERIEALHNLMVARGHTTMKLWITEYGWNEGVAVQTRNLVQALDWLKQQPYIELAHLHMLHNWSDDPVHAYGLMEIVPDANGQRRLTPDTRFTPRPGYYETFRDYPRGGLPEQPVTDGIAFPETGQTISGRFLPAWNERSGLRIIGLPLTRPYPRQQDDGSWLLVQDFQRARLEFHPNLLGTSYEVLGTRSGSQATAGREAELPFQPLAVCDPSADRDCFSETSHSLAYGFRAFWQQRGGLATFGYPISEEFQELNPDTGQMHTVQYFERARFEYHPEHAGTEYEVLLGLLNRDDLLADGWLDPTDQRLPTWREFQ